jgi:hypothetical protein
LAKNGNTHSRSAGLAKGRQPVRKGAIPTALWLALGGLVVVIVGVLLIWRPGGGAPSAVAPQVTGKAKLAVDRDAIDFGTLPLDKTVKATFKLTNVGDKPLTISGQPQVEVLTGC